jgi:hypothetical protein
MQVIKISNKNLSKQTFIKLLNISTNNKASSVCFFIRMFEEYGGFGFEPKE